MGTDVYRAGYNYVVLATRGTTALAGIGETPEEAVESLNSTPIQAAGADWRKRTWRWVMRDESDPVSWAERELVLSDWRERPVNAREVRAMLTRRYYVSHTGPQRSLGLWSGPHDTLDDARASALHAKRIGSLVYVWSDLPDGSDRRIEEPRAESEG